jgi:hypothetical protein
MSGRHGTEEDAELKGKWQAEKNCISSLITKRVNDMKIYTREEVVQKIQEFQALLGREKRLQEELLSLKMYGDNESVRRNTERQDQIVAEIEDIRLNGIMPIMQEMGSFVMECRKIEQEMKAKKQAPAPAEETKQGE